MTISVQRLLTAALLLVGVAAPAPARAQGTETVTNVPFEFTAGDTSLPRDQYRVSPITGPNGAVLVRGLRHGVVLMTILDRSSDRNPAPSLTFRRYGDQYFLKEMQLGDGRILRLSQSRAERKAAESVAAKAESKSTVVVASSSLK
jgi:hypothetical protein